MRQNILKQVIREGHQDWLLSGLPCEKADGDYLAQDRSSVGFFSKRLGVYRRYRKLGNGISKTYLSIPEQFFLGQ